MVSCCGEKTASRLANWLGGLLAKAEAILGLWPWALRRLCEEAKRDTKEEEAATVQHH